jgi:hypothetical protein
MTSRKWKVLQAAKRVAARWLARDYVLSVGIGQRFAEHTWCDEACIVVMVDWKLSAEALRAKKRRPFPRRIEVVVDGKRARVGVDVQETGGETAIVLQSIVGAPVRYEGASIGSVSAVVRAAGTGAPASTRTKTVLISGHVAKHKGRQVEICGMKGTTGEPIRTRRLDHCLVEVVPEPSQCSVLLDGSNLGGVCDVKSLKLGQPLYFHSMATGARKMLAFRGFDLSVPLLADEGLTRMLGLVITDRGTEEGDSGAMLFDETFKAVATLLGAFGQYSYFIPCDYAFAALGIQLA